MYTIALTLPSYNSRLHDIRNEATESYHDSDYQAVHLSHHKESFSPYAITSFDKYKLLLLYCTGILIVWIGRNLYA